MDNFCPLLSSFRWKKKFHHNVTDPVRPNSNIHLSPTCPFVDVWPCAPFSFRQCPRSLSQICTLLPILLKTAAKLIPDPGLQRGSLLAGPPAQPQEVQHGQQDSSAYHQEQGHCAWAQLQAPTAAPLGVSESLGPAWCCPPVLPCSLATACKEEFYFKPCASLSKICTVDKMLHFLFANLFELL